MVFRCVSLCLAVCLVLAALPVRAAEVIRLNYANFPPASTFPCQQMEKWAEEMQKRTNGKVEIATFPGGTLLDARSMLRGVAQGQADIGCISLAYHAGSFPFFNLFGLPLGFDSGTAASKALWEAYKKYQPKELEKYKVLLMFASAPSQIMSTQPVTSLADMGGLTLRASGSLSDVLEAMGGKAVSIPMSETPEALQKGMVKGVFSSWDTLKDLNYAERCRYGLTVNGPVYPFVVVMNRKVWDKLPADVREAMDGYAAEHVAWTGAYVDDWGKQALDWSAATHGFALAAMSQADQQAMRARMAPLLENWKNDMKKIGVDGQAVLDDIQTHTGR